MKKRLAALFLAVCMIAAYIPAFASSLPAALNEIGAQIDHPTAPDFVPVTGMVTEKSVVPK